MLFGGSATVSVLGAEVAVSSPATLVPVTSTRIVDPTSAGVRSYVSSVAPAIGTQLAPAASQRSHW